MPSTSPDPTPALPASLPNKEQVPPTTSRKRSDSKSLADDIEKLMAAKAKEDPLHITKKDAARIESVEHKALGHRPPSGSVAAQVQAMADKVENFHKVADHMEQKLRQAPSSVTKEDAQHLLSKEHKVLGHYPPKDSISAAAQRVAAANERDANNDKVTKDEATKDEATKDEAIKDEATKDEATKDDEAKSTTPSETLAARRMSSVDKAKADQFKAKTLDVVIREAKDAFQKELEEEFSKTGEAISLDKESANKVMVEKTEEVESEKARVDEISAVAANGHVKKAE